MGWNESYESLLVPQFSRKDLFSWKESWFEYGNHNPLAV